jgi:hypothetical protein
MTIAQIDHEERAESRLATQYRESANLIGYLKALLSEANALEQEIFDVVNTRTIDNAEGAVLDIIGDLVGQDRDIIDASDLIYFGFSGDPQADSFGTLADPSVGSRFASFNEVTGGTRELEDPEYRLFIRSRIARNMSKGTIQEIIDQIRSLIGAVEVTLTEMGNANINIGIGRLLTANEKVLLTDYDLLPKPAGVRINFLYDYEAGDMFAFSGVIGAKGFGTGKFASGF